MNRKTTLDTVSRAKLYLNTVEARYSQVRTGCVSAQLLGSLRVDYSKDLEGATEVVPVKWRLSNGKFTWVRRDSCTAPQITALLFDSGDMAQTKQMPGSPAIDQF